MVGLMRGSKRILFPTLLSCICLLHVVSPNDDLDLTGVPDSAPDSLVEEVAEFFKGLVRRRRQLPSTQDFDKMGFTEVEKEAMLAVHNGHRSTVDPTAANMIEVRWNEDIGDFAQNWSANCAFQHRSNRNLGEWTNMGENLFFISGARYNVKQAVDSWWNEYRDYTFETKACVSGKQCGHYITAAWAQTEFIGCGITRCDNLQGLTIDIAAYLFVCNYSGRFLSNTRPFEEGTSCSNCPSAYPRCRYNLCVTDDMLTGCEGYNGTTLYISATRANSVSDPMDCPGFTVDPVITTAPTTPVITTTPPETTTDSSNSQNSTDADDGSGRVVVSSILTLVLCLTSCVLTL